MGEKFLLDGRFLVDTTLAIVFGLNVGTCGQSHPEPQVGDQSALPGIRLGWTGAWWGWSLSSLRPVSRALL